MLKDHYSYVSIFSYDEDGISIEFPDLPGCYPCADKDDTGHLPLTDCQPLLILSSLTLNLPFLRLLRTFSFVFCYLMPVLWHISL